MSQVHFFKSLYLSENGFVSSKRAIALQSGKIPCCHFGGLVLFLNYATLICAPSLIF